MAPGHMLGSLPDTCVGLLTNLCRATKEVVWNWTIDLSEYLNEVDYLAKRAERIRREEAAAKKSAPKNN